MDKPLNFIAIFFFFMAIPVLTYSQNNCLTYEGRQVNCLDSLENKIGLWLEFDVDTIAFKAIQYSPSSEVENTKFITKTGIEIEDYSTNLNPSLIEKLRKKVKSNFDWRRVEPRDGKGLVTLSLMINVEGSIIDVRVLRGVHPSFNKEVERAAELIEKDFIFMCSKECKAPIISIFPIQF